MYAAGTMFAVDFRATNFSFRRPDATADLLRGSLQGLHQGRELPGPARSDSLATSGRLPPHTHSSTEGQLDQSAVVKKCESCSGQRRTETWNLASSDPGHLQRAAQVVQDSLFDGEY